MDPVPPTEETPISSEKIDTPDDTGGGRERKGYRHVIERRQACRRLTLKSVLQAVDAAGGIVTDVAKLLGVSVAYLYKEWRHRPEVEQAFEVCRAAGCEVVTDTVYQRAIAGDMKAAKLYLQYSPIAKSNGWVSETTVKFKSDKPLDPDERAALLKELFG